MNKINLLLALIAFQLLIFNSQSKATHNIGGFISCTHISGYTYKIKVTTVTNSGPTIVADRCSMTVNFSDGSSIVIPRVNGPASTLLCDTLGSTTGQPIAPDLKLNIYEGLKTFNNEGDYYMYVQDPNRNADIINLPNSVDVPMYFETTISVLNPLYYCPNSSLDFGMLPNLRTIVNQNYEGSFPVIFTEGDSVTYSVDTCRMAHGITIPLYTLPPFFTLLSDYGKIICSMPPNIGGYALAIRAKKWRKGQLVSTTLIDYAYRVHSSTVTPIQPNITGNFIQNADSIYVGNFSTSDSIYFNYNNANLCYVYSEIDSLATRHVQGTTVYHHLNNLAAYERKQPYKLTLQIINTQSGGDVMKDFTFYFTIGNNDSTNCTLPIDLGFSQKEKLNTINLFPNPANDILNVQIFSESNQKIKIDLMNIEGQVLKSIEKNFIIGSVTQTIDTSDLPQGIYFLQVRQKTGNSVLKFVKM